MQRKLMAILALTVLASSAHAVTCENNIPASNPDAVYEVSADGTTVTDSRTGLTWKRCVEGMTWDGTACVGAATNMSWAGALSYAENHEHAGQDDWRLPNIKELRGLVETCRTSPAINDTVFPGTPSWYVWSGSPYARYTDYAWYVLFGYGGSDHGSRSLNAPVRLVRGGQSFGPLVVDGVCGSAQGVATITEPAANLCSAGSATDVINSSGQWQWSCEGQHGGVPQACNAPVLGGGVPAEVNPVPTLSQWMLALTAGLMLMLGMGYLRRRI